MERIFKILKFVSKLLGFMKKEDLYKAIYPWVYKQIEKIDFADDEFEEKTEDVLEAVADIVLRFILGIPLDEEIKVDLPKEN